MSEEIIEAWKTNDLPWDEVTPKMRVVARDIGHHEFEFFSDKATQKWEQCAGVGPSHNPSNPAFGKSLKYRLPASYKEQQ